MIYNIIHGKRNRASKKEKDEKVSASYNHIPIAKIPLNLSLVSFE